MIHQQQYKWLEKEVSPKVIAEAIKLYGTREIVGKEHSKEILSWAKELGMEKTYTNDEIPWCGLFAAIVVKRAGFTPVVNPLWARNWNQFGTLQKTCNVWRCVGIYKTRWWRSCWILCRGRCHMLSCYWRQSIKHGKYYKITKIKMYWN